MNALRALILLAFVGVLSIPFLLRAAGVGGADGGGEGAAPAPGGARPERLIVVTPHIEQIRIEFARAFSAWHQAKHGSPVEMDYRTPGGTTEILQLLQAQFTDRIQSGRIRPDGSCEAGVIDFDVMFGGGSYDHGRLKTGVKVKLRDGTEASVPISTPPAREGGGLGLSTAALKQAFGEATVKQVAEYIAGRRAADRARLDARRADELEKELRRRFGVQEGDDVTTIPNIGIGAGYLFDPPDAGKRPPDPGQYWIGTALSGFGIIYNRDRLAGLGNAPEPVTFDLLRDFRFFNQLALADPRQSGSVATAYDSILNDAARAAAAKGGAREAGWAHGWATLRDIVANARYFTSASTQPPLDVSQGEAAAGIAIDFYGRYQAQALLAPGQSAEHSRMGYVDPAGAVYIDADPVSVLRGGPNPVVARRFVEFCLTPEAQALWQFAPRKGRPATGGADGLGPWEYRLRRLPVMRAMYDPRGPYYEHLADRVDPFEIASSATVQGWRDGMIVMFGCWIDAGEDMRRAWRALNLARADPGRSASDLAEMERLFYAMPMHTLMDGREVEFGPATYRQISDDVNRWRDPVRGTRAKIAYTRFFKENWRKVADMGGR